jgi:hypothetical protein
MITLLNTVMCVVHIVHLGIPQPSLASTTPLVINVHFSNCSFWNGGKRSLWSSQSNALSDTESTVLSETESNDLSDAESVLSLPIFLSHSPSSPIQGLAILLSTSLVLWYSYCASVVFTVWLQLLQSWCEQGSSNPGANSWFRSLASYSWSHWAAKPLKYPATEPQDHWAAKLPSYRAAELSSYNAAELPSYRAAELPSYSSCRAAELLILAGLSDLACLIVYSLIPANPLAPLVPSTTPVTVPK